MPFCNVLIAFILNITMLKGWLSACTESLHQKSGQQKPPAFYLT